MAATTPLTVREFLEQKFAEGERVELAQGEIVRMGTAGARHEHVKSNVLHCLTAYTLERPVGRVYVDTMFQLSDTEARVPDVSLLLNEQIPSPLPDGLFQGAPALAVEVVSSESAADLERKVELYLEVGARSVWVVFPEQRVVYVYSPDGTSRRLRGPQTIELDWLPGLAIPAERFFEGL
jgi:Uma2 family endonuclease